MTPQDFIYWLQGYAELSSGPPNAAQWQQIKDHLALCFDKVTPEKIPESPPTTDHVPFVDFASILVERRQANRVKNRLLC